MSIASKPNALAATTICDRVYKSSRRDDVRIIEVSAQSASSDKSFAAKSKKYVYNPLQQTTGHLYSPNRSMRLNQLTRSVLITPPKRGLCLDFQPAIFPIFHKPFALSMLGIIRSGTFLGDSMQVCLTMSDTKSKSSPECIFGKTRERTRECEI